MIASPTRQESFMFCFKRSVAAFWLLALLPLTAHGQVAPTDPLQKLFPEGQPAQVEVDVVEMPAELAEQVEQWIEELGSDQFATRERVANHLIEVGKPALPRLRELAKQTDDPEVRVRAEEIISRMTLGDMATRIEDFIAGDDVGFEGWQNCRQILGDTLAIRELFVQIMQAHPSLVASMDQAARDRAIAMDQVVTSIQNGMFVERKMPTRADAFALLLPAVDDNVPVNAAFESVVLSVLDKEAASNIYRDAQLAVPFKRLIGRWVMRSTLTNREEVLLTGLRWEIETTLPLALQTLTEAQQSETLAIALQAISRFGTREQIPAVAALLDDTRPAAELAFTNGKATRTQLGDVAMATIAVLCQVPLKDAGFPHATLHPVYSLIVDELGFPEDDPAPRKQAREFIDALIAPPAAPEGS
jgi:hypothetical protein